MPFALIGIAGIIIYGFAFNTLVLSWHIIPVLVFYPAWGIIQQFMMVGIIARNLRALTASKAGDPLIILLTTLLFSLVHYPSVSLMSYAFVMEFILLHVYFKWKNLWPLGLFHGWVSCLFLFIVLERDLLNELWLIFQ